jgi:glycolate oxidase FAD binding subunit
LSDMTSKIEGLSGVVDKGLIKTEPHVLAGHGVDGVLPKAVVFPTDVKQVAEVVKYANREALSLVPWGRGTKIGLGYPPKKLDMVVSTSRLNQITDVDAANLTMTVRAGVRFMDAQARVASQENRCYLPLEDPVTESDEMVCSDREHTGCFIPLDPPHSDRATVGGILAANSTGPRRLLYGLPRDIVLGVRFVAPSGEIIGAGGKTVKNVSGYDISKLMIGSAGSLGILCEMTLRLLPLPERMETILVGFGTLEDAGAFAERIFASSLLPAAVEVMNGVAFGALALNTKPDLGGSPFVVAVALEAFEEQVKRMVSGMRDAAKASKAATDAILGEEGHRDFWRAVSNLDGSACAGCDGYVSLKLNYPISEWKSVMGFVQDSLKASNISHTILTHAGSGVGLIGLLVQGKDGDAKGQVANAVHQILGQCRSKGGNLVVQRAPAPWKTDLPIWGEPGEDFLIMKRIRQQLDPLSILCPGRFVSGI